MLLNAQNIKKEYGIQTVLDIEKLEIGDGERIGLIGRNGAGKSTLFGVLTGRIACEEGIIRRNCEIAEILQTGDSDGEPDGRFISQMKLRESAVKSGVLPLHLHFPNMLPCSLQMSPLQTWTWKAWKCWKR